jgi:hypothetical protein
MKTSDKRIKDRDAMRWRDAVALLSLDIVAPFWSDMGLRPRAAVADLMIALRNAIAKVRESHGRGVSDPKVLSKELVENIENYVSRGTFDELDRWVEHDFVYRPKDRGNLYNWRMLLGICRTRDKYWNSLFANLPADIKNAARERLAEVLSPTNVRSRMDQVEALPPTNWDVEIFARHGYDRDDHPHDRVWFMVKNTRTQEYLDWLRARLDSEQLQRLAANAEALRRELEALSPLKPFSFL